MGTYSVTILANSLDTATQLRGMGLDLHERAARRRRDTGDIAVPAILDDEGIQRVQAAGYRLEIGQDLEQVAIARAGKIDTRANRFAPSARTDERAGADADAVAPALRTLEVLVDLADLRGASAAAAARSVLGGYLTPTEVETALTTLAAAHPGIASVTALPERSWENRTTHVLQIRAGSPSPRVGVLVTGSMHAREWGGSDICIAFATNLLKSYAAGAPLQYGGKTFTAAQIKSMLERLDLFVFADVNPDGKTFSQTNDPTGGGPQNIWWRKNRNPNTGLGGPKGVDVNRNFNFLWSSGIGTSSDPSSFTYKGQAAFSEPETRNVRWLLDTFGHIAYYVDVHSHGELILFSWGDDENQTSSSAQNFLNPAFDGLRGQVGDTAYREFIPSGDQTSLRGLARSMNASLRAVRGRSYMVQQAVGLYATSGTSDDYAFSRHRVNPALSNVRGFTIEFGREFVPPYAEMQKIMADVAAALTRLCQHVTGV